MKRGKISGQFAPRTIEMLRSPAWRVLSLSARRILDRIEIELASHGGRDNGRLPVTYANLKAYGICNRDAIAGGKRELRALGFVESIRGHAGNGEFRRPTLFRLTYLPAYGKSPTHEWRRIETLKEAEKIARKARRTIERKTKHRSRKPGLDRPEKRDVIRSRKPGRCPRNTGHGNRDAYLDSLAISPAGAAGAGPSATERGDQARTRAQHRHRDFLSDEGRATMTVSSDLDALSVTIDDPHDVAVIDDGEGIYAVFATSPHARKCVEDLAPTLSFDTEKTLPVDTTVAAATFCSEEHAQNFCNDLRTAGLVVAFQPRRH